MAEVMLVDWLDNTFPKRVPGDYELDKKSDTGRVGKFLRNNKNCFEFVYQLGVLNPWLTNADQSIDEYKVYSQLPEISLKYAFECPNGCPNIYTQKGCLGNLKSVIYVINSSVPKEKMDVQLYATIKKPSLVRSSIGHFGATNITWVDSNNIIGAEGSVLTLFDRNKESSSTLEHGKWKVEEDHQNDFK
jgi:hypothetical protein